MTRQGRANDWKPYHLARRTNLVRLFRIGSVGSFRATSFVKESQLMYARISAFLVACALVVTGLASAQERFGALTGRVTDQQGQAVPGVTVIATNTQSGQVRTFVTDADGMYNAQALVPGR